jgi:glycolate oxidase iron-sulfur subunit
MIAASREWLTAAAARDLDSCLGCLRCEQACPAQVRYGEMIDSARQLWLPPPRRTRWWLWLAARPRALQALTAIGRIVRRCWPLPLLRGLEPAPARAATTQLPATTIPDALLLSGCSARALEPRALAALQQLTRLAGLRIDVLDSGCCGALQRHAGQLTEGRALADRHWRRSLAQAPAHSITLLGWASGCQQQLRETAPAQCTTESVLSWALRVMLPRLPSATAEAAALELPGLWIPCTLPTQAAGAGVLEHILQHECGKAWRKLAALGCCGAAGIRHLGGSGASHSLSDAVLDAALAQGCQLIVSANPGCLHALRARSAERKLQLSVVHLFDWLLQRRQPSSSSISALPAASD